MLKDFARIGPYRIENDDVGPFPTVFDVGDYEIIGPWTVATNDVGPYERGASDVYVGPFATVSP